MIGETISHYRILERLGAGGMGEVYKAEDTRLQRLVALKMLLDEGQKNEQSRARFVREARAASAISHPNVATIYEIDEAERDGRRYSFIVMEYVQGRMLKDLVGELSLLEAIEIIEQMADGLATAHELGIVHRDIKPSNAIVTDQQLVKILDFGVAKYTPLLTGDEDTASLFATEVMKTTPGMVTGTYAYMSPEQARGLEVDHRSDIFSLGVVAYELIQGRQPFTGSSALAVVDSLLHANPQSLSSTNPQVTPELDRLIRRMLDKDRDLRYQSLRDVAADLDRAKRDATRMLSSGSFDTNRDYATQAMAPEMHALGTTSMRRVIAKSVAVLSFTNVTQRTEDDWLGVGIAETVTADLKNVEGIVVIGRERIYEAVRHWHQDLRTDFDEKLATRIGQEVGARWIIGGGYQRLGEMLRITARLVEVETGEVVNTVKIDGQMSEVFALQDRIVQELSADLDLSLQSGELKAIAMRDTDNIEAFEAVSRATLLAYTSTRQGLDDAIAQLEKAISLDPKYARAYGLLGYVLTLKGQFLSQNDLLEKAVEYIWKAIELRPMMAESYGALGATFIAMNRITDAIGALNRALAFAPEDSLVLSSLGRAYYIGKGMFREAAGVLERALRGRSAENTWIAPSLGQCYIYLGEYERAEQLIREAIEAQERYATNHEGVQIIGAFAKLGHIHYLRGHYDEAITEYDRELAFAERSEHALKDRMLIEVHQKLASAFVRQGRMDEARKAYEQMLNGFAARLREGADDPFTRYYVACGAAMMGETEEAFEHLAKAIEGRRRFNIARARVEKDFEALRDDARFQALVNDSK